MESTTSPTKRHQPPWKTSTRSHGPLSIEQTQKLPPMDADAARAWRARRLGRVRIPGAGADERGHDGPVPQEDAGRGTTQGRLHDQARRGAAAQLDHGTGSVQRQARRCRPTITPGPFRNNTRYSNLQIITVCRSGRRGSSTRRI